MLKEREQKILDYMREEIRKKEERIAAVAGIHLYFIRGYTPCKFLTFRSPAVRKTQRDERTLN